MAKAKTEPEKTEPQVDINMNILEKINAIRKAWSDTEVAKEGNGKAGGGAKYDYYKPQQIIDFCLAQELKYGLFSEFKIQDGVCSYVVTNIGDNESRSVECPFDIPRKMAASEAQQVGAAMTYHNRRLAMMMYKIEDNSKENVDVLQNADFSMQNILVPEIPAPPIITPPPVSVAPPSVESVVPPEAPSAPVSEVKAPDTQETVTAPEPPKNDEPAVAVDSKTEEVEAESKVVGGGEATLPTKGLPDMSAYGNHATPPPPITPYISPKDVMDGKVKNGVVVETPQATQQVAPPEVLAVSKGLLAPPQVEEVAKEVKATKSAKSSIEDLYS